ncbi:MAG: glycosyltransferase family 2 protein [Chloroflexi bacterium]|nr:glycosyltransferase family 2 protein [Chloroflexota bacterium]
MQVPFLSVIIPAYNEEKRLPNTLEQVFDFLNQQKYTFEVVIVDNCSRDRTLEIAQAYRQRYNPNCVVVQETIPGKGSAVRRGMLTARGQYRFMCDADLSMPIAEINKFLPPKLNGYDIAIGSRETPGAVRYNEPYYRHLGGRLVNTMIQALILYGLNDTQCGFKCFRAHVAEDIFRAQKLTNFSFDIELLYLAKLRAYRIDEIPISYYYDTDTTLNPVRATFQMAKDILTIRSNARRGLYAVED